MSIGSSAKPILFSENGQGAPIAARVDNINAYLVSAEDTYIEPLAKAPSDRPTMYWGNKPTDGGHLIMSSEEALLLIQNDPAVRTFIKSYYGSTEFIKGLPRRCIWVAEQDAQRAAQNHEIRRRFENVRQFRSTSGAKETRPAADFPYRFRQIQGRPGEKCLIVPIHSSETRAYLPAGLLADDAIVSNAAYAIYSPETWHLAVIVSRLHLIWIATVCGKIKTDFRYSNTLGWNTFPLPQLTEKNKGDLIRSAEDIMLVREAHFPASIADLYEPDNMPSDLREAHERNDEIFERIYIREQGIICDIDIWNNNEERTGGFVEVKAQQVRHRKAKPLFYLSSAEWRSFRYANSKRMNYRIWLVQYKDLDELRDTQGKIRVLECGKIATKWITPEVLIVSPEAGSLKTILAA